MGADGLVPRPAELVNCTWMAAASRPGLRACRLKLAVPKAPALKSSATRPSLPCKAGQELMAVTSCWARLNSAAVLDWLVTLRLTTAPLVLVTLIWSQAPTAMVPVTLKARRPLADESRNVLRLAVRKVVSASALPAELPAAVWTCPPRDW